MAVAPFKGLRVVELGATQAGAQAGQFLADFGAEVVMIEPPQGSPLRADNGFPFWARGKRSLVLDPASPDDRAALARLLQEADILIETGTPAQLDLWGLACEQLAAANPRLILGSITPFGPDSPYAGLPGYEQLIYAKLGVLRNFARMSPTPQAPPYVSVPFATHAATQALLHGILAALIERARSGLGQQVETNMVLAFLTLDSWAWFEHAIARRFPDAMSVAPSFDAQGRPCHHLMMRLLVSITDDGAWMQFAATAPRLFKAKMNALGLGWMFTDPDWSNVPMFDDPDKFMDLWTRMLESARTRSLAQWQAVFDADRDVFAEQFRACDDILDHPQLGHDGFSITLDDPERGPVRQPGPLLNASATPASLCPAPRLDADRGQLLGHGWSEPALPLPAPASPPPCGLPLEGVTIVEFCSMFAAPGGPALLTELGARVIKVEPPEGDPIRNIASLPEVAGIRPMMGKESICIDLSKPEGRDLARELCRDADVVIQSYRAGAIERLGLDYASIRAINPDVVYLNASGYGTDGPFGHRPAYAPSIGAGAGAAMANLGLTGEDAATLTIDQIRDISRRLGGAGTTDVAQADGVACNAVATAILFGLIARERSGAGQELGTSMLNTSSHMMSGFAVTWPGASPPAMVAADLTGLNALYRIYPAAGGFIFVGVLSDPEWHALAVAVGRPDLAADERFISAAARKANDAALADLLGPIFLTRPADEWEARCTPLRLGVVEVSGRNMQGTVMDTPFGAQHHLMVDVIDPTWGELPRQAPHVCLSRSAVQAKAAVLAGQQTDEVLRKAGMEPRIAQLRADGVVT